MSAYEEAKAMFYNLKNSKPYTASDKVDCYNCRYGYLDYYDDADCVCS